MRVYSYSLRMVMRPDSGDKYKDLRTNYLTDIRTGIIPDLHQIKWSVIRSASLDIGTNAYLVDCNQDIPHFETVLPVVKSYLIESY